MNVSTRDAIEKRLEADRKNLATIKDTKEREAYIAESTIFRFLKIEDNLVRFYPERNITSQITGYVDTEGNGNYGVEGYFQDMIQAESPKQEVIKDSANRPIDGYVSKDLIIGKNGVDITLTIDRNIQKEIRAKLASAVERFRANK